jgi:hypothetical protein
MKQHELDKLTRRMRDHLEPGEKVLAACVGHRGPLRQRIVVATDRHVFIYRRVSRKGLKARYDLGSVTVLFKPGLHSTLSVGEERITPYPAAIDDAAQVAQLASPR